MDENRAATCLEALGHPTRLAIYRVLVRAGPDGARVGAIRDALGVPASTLTHHLSTLAHADLIRQDRRGREIISVADFAVMNGVVGFLTEHCCEGLGAAN